MGDKQAKGGAELAARFKQYDYKAVRGCCCCRCCCCKGVQGCAWGLVRLCVHARCACVPLRIHACMRACSPARPPARTCAPVGSTHATACQYAIECAGEPMQA